MEEKDQNTVEQENKEAPKETQEEAKAEDSVTLTKAEYEELLKGKEAEKKLLYAYAEFENFKRRQKKDMEDKIKFSNEHLVKEILPVLDNLILAKDHALKTEDTSNIKHFIEGVELILKQMSDVLNNFGVTQVLTVGQKFDPYMHEALSQVESPDHEAGMIVNEFQRGYTMHGRLIRSAKVVIAKQKQENI